MYRLDKLIKLDRKLYHTNDLALAWNITNKNTLYTAIKRYVKKGILISVYKGLYSTTPLSQLDSVDLGRAIVHQYSYLSTESILVKNGVITQNIYFITFVSGVSKKVKIGDQNFLFRKLKNEFLYNPAGIQNQNGNLVATTERAVADMLYFDPKYHFDLSENINFDKVRQIQKEIGYPC